ncbi:DNA repair protein SWI5 homolog, partial [Aquarana catesbeiana]|uniref:DNA repair protein SWI5 homolog n=1 Tax=Aquarana catesbeiana TaxID=8400 RepID=UPI003CCA62ED
CSTFDQSSVWPQSCRLESPRSTGAPKREDSAVTPRQTSFLTPRPRGSLRRTPLGNRKNVNSVFKSPVQQPNISQSPGGDEDTLGKAISELKEKEASLDKEMAQLQAEGYSLAELDKHISLLHEYNELKDTGQMLLGHVAILRGITTKDLYSEFGLDLED